MSVGPGARLVGRFTSPRRGRDIGEGQRAMITVREEKETDVPAIRRVNELAFETPAEADLVDLLRSHGKLIVSLVAAEEDRIVAHIAFSPVTVEDEPPERRGAGLGPMAVLPALQRQGIGSRLVREGLDRCRRLGVSYVVVLGHAEYYPRFGFTPASSFGLRCTWPVPDGVFMAMELRARALAGAGGLVRYQPEFGEV